VQQKKGLLSSVLSLLSKRDTINIVFAAAPSQDDTLKVNSYFRKGSTGAGFAHVPTHAYTLTIPALLQAEYLFCTVPGPTKAEAVYRTANEGISEDCPATIMRNHPNAYMYCDAESGKELL
jgi:6-phosphogluconolactonase/glucosamine-6-phosphate isomerase/deaminase